MQNEDKDKKMNIIYKDQKLSNKTAVALGNFDGVHAGHKAIIMSAIKYARENFLTSCVYTFSEHPSKKLGCVKAQICTTEDKISLIEMLGCDTIYFEEFDDVREMSPETFCEKIIKDKLCAECVFCGENYRFGYMGAGDISVLKTELMKYGIETVVVPYVTFEENIVSSTAVRNSISEGNIKAANEMLGHIFSVSGTVYHGKKLGRKLGFPTLNIILPDSSVIPKFGVYVSECLLDGKMYKAISNIGIRPTTDSNTENAGIVNCETYLMEYSGDAYGKSITVFLHEMIRPEMRFNSIDLLISRIDEDVLYAKKYFEINHGESK